MASPEAPAQSGGSEKPAAPAAAPQRKTPFERYPIEQRIRMFRDDLKQWQNGPEQFMSLVAQARGLSSTAENAELKAAGERYFDLMKAATLDQSNPSWQKLILCNPDTVIAAAKKLAEYDIELNETAGLGSLAFRRTSDPEFYPYEAVPCPGARAIERALVRTTAVKKIDAFAVRQQDSYTFTQGGDSTPELRRNLNPDTERTNAVYAAFCRIVLKDDTNHITEVAIDTAALDADRGNRDSDGAAADVARIAAISEVIRQGYADRHIHTGAKLRDLHELLEMQDKANAVRAEERTLPSLQVAAPAPAIVVKPAQVPTTQPTEAKPAAAEPMVPIIVGGEEWAQRPAATATTAVDPIQRSVASAAVAAKAEMPASAPAAPKAAPLPSPFTPRTGSGRRV